MKKLLYATNNPGKLFEVSKLLESSNVEVISPQDLDIDLDIEETGETLEANASLKISAFLDYVTSDIIVMADDTGVEIDALNGEPGIHVRRWQDGKTRLTDQQVINYCLKRMQGIPPAKRTAKFRTVVALGVPEKEIELFDGILAGTIVEKPGRLRYEGFPFETLFYIPEWGKLLGEVHDLPIEEKIKQKLFTHRERAVLKALPRIKTLLK
jgi:XTP/dITP diphosphohydrolase